MEVMTTHKFFDEDVEKVIYSVEIGMSKDVREIVLKGISLLINKDDAVALAKEFGLLVFEEESKL